jgi:hypothetical protein
MILLLPSHQGKEKAQRNILEHQSYGAPARHGAPDKRLQQHLLEVDLCSSMQTRSCDTCNATSFGHIFGHWQEAESYTNGHQTKIPIICGYTLLLQPIISSDEKNIIGQLLTRQLVWLLLLGHTDLAHLAPA